jgi:membrane-bound serine protease (ClpP class)
MPFAVALLDHPAGVYAFLVAAIVASLYAALKPAFVPTFAGAAAALLTLLGFSAVPPDYAALLLLAIGIALLHAEFLLPTSGALGALGLAVTAWASMLLLAPSGWPELGGPTRVAASIGGTLVLFGAVAHTMRLRTLPKS